MDKHTLIQRLIEIGVIEKRQVTLKNAGESSFYINIKKDYGYPDILRKITHMMHRRIDRQATTLAAQGYGGLPLATKLSSDYNLKLTLIREQQKDHGLDNLLEGYIPTKDDKVFLVDDVLTTGDSLRQILQILGPTQTQVIGCGVVVKRGSEGLQVPLHYILTLDDLIKH